MVETFTLGDPSIATPLRLGSCSVELTPQLLEPRQISGGVAYGVLNVAVS
jgi:hypothetical protein